MSVHRHRPQLSTPIALCAVGVLAFVVGCSSHEPPAGSADASSSTHVAATTASALAPSTSATAAATTASAAAVPSAAVATASATATASASAAAPAAPLPDVEVKNIGMHIGGGPNDAPTKAPIKRSVEPHFDEFRACFAKVSDPKKGGDVSVDLHIDKDGGKAALTKYKSALSGEGFEECVKAVFVGIDFEKPKTGTTNVSYGLGFRPKK